VQNINKALASKAKMEKDIGKIKKNDTTDIVVRIDDFGGRTGITIREFTTSEGYTGFTKSGTRIPAESFAEFKTMVNSINEADLQPAAQEQPATEQPQEQPAEDNTI
jgi:hypothetical protein